LNFFGFRKEYKMLLKDLLVLYLKNFSQTHTSWHRRVSMSEEFEELIWDIYGENCSTNENQLDKLIREIVDEQKILNLRYEEKYLSSTKTPSEEERISVYDEIAKNFSFHHESVRFESSYSIPEEYLEEFRLRINKLYSWLNITKVEIGDDPLLDCMNFNTYAYKYPDRMMLIFYNGHVSQSNWDDPEFCLKMLKENPQVLKYVNQEILPDRENLLCALCDENPEVFRYVKQTRLKNREELVKNMIRKNPYNLQHVQDQKSLKNREEIVLSAVIADPGVLKHVEDQTSLKNREEVVRTALACKKAAMLQYVQDQLTLKNREDIMTLAVKANINNYKYIQDLDSLTNANLIHALHVYPRKTRIERHCYGCGKFVSQMVLNCGHLACFGCLKMPCQCGSKVIDE